MVDSIKITALQDIGANIAYTTLVPVVNMAGTPTTQKSNLQNLGNLILNGAGGSYFARAAQANLALSVANAAQPNITSVGTLSSLAVSGNISSGNANLGNIAVANFYYGDGRFLTNVVANSSYSNSNVASYLPTYTGDIGAGNIAVTSIANLGAVGNVRITGGTSGQKLTTDGAGNLTWTNDANSSYGNSNVAAYLPTYTGNVGAANIRSAGNLGVTANTLTWNFTNQGVLQWPGGIGQIDTNNSVFEIHSTNGFQISTNEANSSQNFLFDTDGVFTAPSNVNLLGTRLNVGPGANALSELEGAVLVASSNSIAFIQGVIENVSDNGSADWVAQGHRGNDNGGYVNLGFNSSGHNDANHTISGPGDGYVLVDGYANGQAPLPTGGNLVLATSSQGLTKDIVFATGGFLANAEFARIDHANNVFYLTRAGSGIKFADGSIQTTAYTGGANTGNVTFDDVTVQGVNGLNLSAGPDFTANLAYLQVRAGDVATHIHLDTGNNQAYDQYFGDDAKYVKLELGDTGNVVIGTDDANGNLYTWSFASDGTIIFPTLEVDLHNGGVQTGQVLQFGNSTQQAIITGPTPDANVSAQRLIVQGQRGNGELSEGGDVYFWAGDADLYGGDIKIYAGDADNVADGYGGYVNIDGGAGHTLGGQVEITGGYSSSGDGGYVNLIGGIGATHGGNVGIQGGRCNGGPGGIVTIQGGFSSNGLAEYGNVSIAAGAGTWTFNNDGNLTLPDTSKVVGLLTSSFTGTIAGTTLTVTGATPGTIAWEQTVEGPGVAADTFIITQLTGTSGGNGTYSVTVSQNVGPVTMNVAAMYLNGSLKLGVNHAIYQQDEDDTTLYNFLIGIEAQEGTIHIGDINTNGVCIPNDKEYKGHSNLNPGTFMSVGKVDSADQVILSSGNAANTLIRVGGDSTTTGYGMKFLNGGQALMPVGLRIGDNINSSIFAAPLEVGSILGAAANNQSSPGGIALPTYRGTGTVIANDEWGSYIYGARYRGTINTPLPVKDGDWLMEFGATAFDGTNNNGGGEIALRVDGTVTGSSNPSKIEFYNTLTGANSQSLGMVLDSSQKLSVSGPVKTVATTIALLGSAATAGIGARAFATDANLVAAGNFGAQVGGGGANTVPVYSDGTNWYIG